MQRGLPRAQGDEPVWRFRNQSDDGRFTCPDGPKDLQFAADHEKQRHRLVADVEQHLAARDSASAPARAKLLHLERCEYGKGAFVAPGVERA
jgi:hypothetical protein